MQNEIETYLSMQRRQYEYRAGMAKVHKDHIENEAVVGSYADQERFPYDENILKYFTGDTSKLSILEYGCGPGRNLVRLSKRFGHVAGVDISAKNIENARKLLELNKVKSFDLIVTTGDNIPTQDQYDLVFEVICLQHICSYSIRKRILADMVRCCKYGGIVVLQFGYNTKTLPKSNHNTRFYADYYDDQLIGIEDTNGAADCCVTDIEQPVKDLLELGLSDIKTWETATVNDVNHDSWLWLKGTK